ncbi:MAG: type III polyketide synthase [Pirellulaceae bacterium]|nr:type III polyketide synthase [Pirellulaceae bacterium]
MSLSIHGLGTATPPFEMTQQESLDLACRVTSAADRDARLLKALHRKSRVERRHTIVPHSTAIDWRFGGGGVRPEGESEPSLLGPTTSGRMQLYDQYATDLAAEAIVNSIASAPIELTELTHLITVSCTGFAAPGVDIKLIRRFELNPEIERVHIGFMGCHGAINGLRVAQAIANADPAAKVLLCAVEVCSLHYRLDWKPEQLVGNLLFSDGAASVLCGNSESTDWRLINVGSCLLPSSQDAITWRIGDHGFEMSLSPEVPDLIGEHLRPWLSQWLRRNGVEPSDVAHWAVHPGGPRVITSVAEALSLPPDATSASRDVLAQFGNMSSPTILFIVDELRRRGATGLAVAVAFGPGVVAEAALFDFGSN